MKDQALLLVWRAGDGGGAVVSDDHEITYHHHDHVLHSDGSRPVVPCSDVCG